MEKEKRKFKHSKEYLNDFKLDENNKYVYTNKVYELDMNEEDKKSLFKKLLLYVVVLIISLIISGCINIDALRYAFYVEMGYALEVIFGALLVYVLIEFYIYRNELREYRYKKYYLRIKPYVIIASGLAIVSLIGIIVYYIINPNENEALLSLLFLLLKVLEFVMMKKILDKTQRIKIK